MNCSEKFPGTRSASQKCRADQCCSCHALGNPKLSSRAETQWLAPSHCSAGCGSRSRCAAPLFVSGFPTGSRSNPFSPSCCSHSPLGFGLEGFAALFGSLSAVARSTEEFSPDQG